MAATGIVLVSVPTIVAAGALAVSEAVPPLLDRIAPVALTVLVQATTPVTTLPGAQVTLPGELTVIVATVGAVTWTANVLAAAAGRLAPSRMPAALMVARSWCRMVFLWESASGLG